MSDDKPEHGRRRFLTLVGAQAALAQIASCVKSPPEQILPYVEVPRELVESPTVCFATASLHAGYATGVIATSVSGRPIKIEGNPRHTASLGATDIFAQTALATLYDPERAQIVTRRGRITTVKACLDEIRRALAANPNRTMRILTGTLTSPSVKHEIDALLAAFPGSEWCCFEPCGEHSTRAGLLRAFGAPAAVHYDLSSADVVCAIDSDFAAAGPGHLRYARELSARRVPTKADKSEGSEAEHIGPGAMNRFFAIESSPTVTGTLADHRLFVRPTEIGVVAAMLAAELGVVPPEAITLGSSEAQRMVKAVASDLRAVGPRALVIAGEPASPAVHVLAAAMNEALGATGTTVLYTDPVELSPVDQVESLRRLVSDLSEGRVSVLLILGQNPVATSPYDIDFANAMKNASLVAHCSLYTDETSWHSHYHIPQSHFLESWGDASAFDGTLTLIQPIIEPLYTTRTMGELLAEITSRTPVKGRDLVLAEFRRRFGDDPGDLAFSKALSLGFVRGTQRKAQRPALADGALEKALEDIASQVHKKDGYEVAFRPDPTIFDGSYAQNGALQELPKPLTKLVWESAILCHPAAAVEIGAATGDVVELASDGRVVRGPIYVLPDHPKDTLTLSFGYGRPMGAREASGINAYELRASTDLWSAAGIIVRRTGDRADLATTQQHFTLHGRHPVRIATVAEILSGAHPAGDASGEHGALSMYPGFPSEGRAWGMTIDLSRCTGCSVCVAACQAENNIPIVGREGVLMGREMHWLRVDRYEVTGEDGTVAIVNEPMMCVHCERAPCEYVCPVGATTHSTEGLNEMTYNRCVGTRYCSNNCPYKVRRFNYFDYHKGEANVATLKYNPEVTVRTRGVMEKCTYCVQRIAHARIVAEREGRPIADGEIVTACQQACPTSAIVFGDLSDPGSRVSLLRASPRSYRVLAELNTEPRTSHLASVKNPSPELSGYG